MSEVPKFSFWIGLDFYTAYGAAHALSVGDSPYNPIAIDDFARVEHLPRIGGDILGATPFWVWANQALLPLQARTAAWIWFLLSSLALLGGLALTETLIREAHPPTEPRHLRRLRVAMFVFLPNWGAVFIGQSTSLVLLLWVVAGLLVVRRAPVAASSV
jgi:hypothetical protein